MTGCKQQVKLPQWDGYTPPVFPDYRGDVVQAQIATLEADIEDYEAHDLDVPPGYYAQLGLLYFSLGRTEQLRQRIKAEDDLFSASIDYYMDALMKNAPTVELLADTAR